MATVLDKDEVRVRPTNVIIANNTEMLRQFALLHAERIDIAAQIDALVATMPHARVETSFIPNPLHAVFLIPRVCHAELSA